MPYCRACDERRPSDARFCPDCGSRLVRPTEQTGDPMAEPETQNDQPVESDESDPHELDLIAFAFKFPYRNGYGPLLLGAGLVLLFFLFLPLFVLAGYMYRVGRAAARGDTEPPGYDDWPGLLVDGLLLSVAFLPVALVSGALLGGLWGAAELSDSESTSALLLFASTPVAILLWYFGGAVLPTFIGTGSITGTYSGGRFLRVAMTGKYLVSFLLLFVITLALYLVVSMAALVIIVMLFVTIIGILFIPFFAGFLYLVYYPFYLHLVGAWWGYVWKEAAEEGIVDPVPPDAELGAGF